MAQGNSRRRQLTLSAPEPPAVQGKRAKPSKETVGDKLRFVRLSENATPPARPNKHAAGFTLYSAYDYEVPAGGKFIVLTDLELQVPRLTYGRIAALPRLTATHNMDVGQGYIETNSRGNVGVLVINRNSSESIKIEKGAAVAQLICERVAYPKVIEMDDFDSGVGKEPSAAAKKEKVPPPKAARPLLAGGSKGATPAAFAKKAPVARSVSGSSHRRSAGSSTLAGAFNMPDVGVDLSEDEEDMSPSAEDAFADEDEDIEYPHSQMF